MLEKNYDVIVVGGGASGIAAAIGAAKTGAHCLLIERYGCLGGQATTANVSSYCGFFTHGEHARQVVKGVGQEVLDELHRLGYYDGFRFSPVGNAIVALDQEATKFALDEVISKYPVDVLLHCRMFQVEADFQRGEIYRIICVDDQNSYAFTAHAFVDATGDANLSYLAGASLRYGDGQGKGQASTRIMMLDRVPASVRFKPEVLDKIFIQAKKDGHHHLSKESGIVFRVNDDTVCAILPSVWVPDLSAATLTACEMDTRKQAQEYLEVFHKYMPGMENCRLVSTGVQLGLRDTRHILGEKTLTGEQVLRAVKPVDSIARGAWPCEMHVDVNKIAKYIFVDHDDYYGIPLGCLKARQWKNLWCGGRTISADPVAFASVRVMGCGFATGQAAGVAAALPEGTEDFVQIVQQELVRQGALI
ncbi:FAD-dependent oxidoreductase [Acidaminococcus fermentans]|uniref:FAD-dependent oxidoreductase n=1 Tax=Acidaminococcus fermentans TaxID=905 RepID=UPI00241DDDFC|nr:FAD-dependent oxidoreductase [Acidaminococcus fermentans]